MDPLIIREILAWSSQLAFMLCGVPLAYQAWKNKGIDISLAFLCLWSFGEIAGIAYGIMLGEKALVFNYTFNSIFLAIVWYYRRSDNDKQ